MAEEETKLGRPTLVTPEVVTKLEMAFSHGCSVTEACVFAGISRKVFYEYEERNPDFRDKREELVKLPNLAARMNVVKAVKAGDIDASEWWLERRARDDFATRKETTGKDGGPIETKEHTKPEDVKPEDAQRAYAEEMRNARGTE